MVRISSAIIVVGKKVQPRVSQIVQIMEPSFANTCETPDLVSQGSDWEIYLCIFCS